jgi:hypothetical protein
MAPIFFSRSREQAIAKSQSMQNHAARRAIRSHPHFDRATTSTPPYVHPNIRLRRACGQNRSARLRDELWPFHTGFALGNRRKLRNIYMKRGLYLSLLALLGLALLKPASAQVSIGINIGTPEAAMSVGFAPPDIPDYDQPPCPEDGALWVPGYWAWDDDIADYYWVPGTWVMPPQPGLLWTPAYWSWDNGAYGFHDGYWATEVGFYGGVNYGYGYYGQGFGGGRWQNNHFMYNTAVVNVNQTVIHNVYIDKTVVVNNTTVNRVSFNGGQGGTQARPSAREQQVAQAHHVPPAQAQMQNRQAARSNPELRASTNQGKPAVAATAKPGDFKTQAVAAKSAGGGGWHPPANPREAAKAHNAQPAGNAKPGENAHPSENANRPAQNARPGEPARPAENANQQNNRPEQNAKPGENRPGQIAHPQQNPNPNARPGEPRPGETHPQPNAQPGANGRPNEAPRPQQNTRPQENARPQAPQARPNENPHPGSEKPQARPEQQRPAEKPNAQPKPNPQAKPNPEPKPNTQPKQKEEQPKPKPREQEPPPQQ